MVMRYLPVYLYIYVDSFYVCIVFFYSDNVFFLGCILVLIFGCVALL